MNNQINYQKELDRLLADLAKRDTRPTLLLHACCAPCSSYVLSYLTEYFDITVLFYNPNISPEAEFIKRQQELAHLIAALPHKNAIELVSLPYCPQEFFDAAKGLESCPEGGERCKACFTLRLSRSAEYAAQHHFDYVATTLTISPLKDAALLNTIGAMEAEAFGARWLFSDFKKKEGFKKSIALSHQYHLYRQNYCGCIFSKQG